jgi:hypothetical protein
MAKAHFLEIVDTAKDLIHATGRGVKGEPKLYHVTPF